jgi:hypothetical protein
LFPSIVRHRFTFLSILNIQENGPVQSGCFHSCGVGKFVRFESNYGSPLLKSGGRGKPEIPQNAD